MKVLQVINLGYEAGGAEKIARVVHDEMERLGHEVVTLSTDRNTGGHGVFATATVPTVRGGALARLVRYFWSRANYRVVRRLVDEFDPDIVHFHTLSEFSPAVLWAIGRRPAILSVHGPEEFTLELLPWLLPASDYAGGSFRWADVRFSGRLRYCYFRYIQRPAYLVAMRRLKLVTAPSKFIARTVARDFPHTPIEVLYPGIVIPGEAATSRATGSMVLFVGRLEPVKGADHLIRAFAHVYRDHPESRLRIVGEGSGRGSLEKMAADLGLAGVVEFTGWATPEQLARAYVEARVVAIPSVCPEALGLVGVEALANGRPIIGSNVGGIPELVDPGVTGAVVEPRDEHGMARAIESFLWDEDKLEVAAQMSAVKVREFYVDTFIEKQLQLYRRVVGDGAGD